MDLPTYLTSHSRYPLETGDTLSQLTSGLGETVLAPAAVDALQDPTVQAEIQATITAALEAPETRQALRPYLIEGSLLLAGGIALGGLLLLLIRRRL